MVSNTQKSPAKNRVSSYLRKRYPQIKENDFSTLLSDIERFVRVVQKIYTEPQAQITIRDYEEKGKIVHKKVHSASFEELQKVFDKDKKEQNLIDSMRTFHKSVTKDKYGR